MSGHSPMLRRETQYPVRFSVALSRETAARIERASRACGIVRAVIVRRAIEAGFDEAVEALERELDGSGSTQGGGGA